MRGSFVLMAHSYVMSAGEELPVFHDFLGIVGQRNDSAEPKSCNFSRIRNADLTGHDAEFRGLPTNGGNIKTHSPSISLSGLFLISCFLFLALSHLLVSVNVFFRGIDTTVLNPKTLNKSMRLLSILEIEI